MIDGREAYLSLAEEFTAPDARVEDFDPEWVAAARAWAKRNKKRSFEAYGRRAAARGEGWQVRSL